MKKPYIKPEMDIYEFDTEDIITTSDGDEINGAEDDDYIDG